MNKFILIIPYFIAHFSLIANMVEPVVYGTLGSNPFTSSYVDIQHENLVITIDENFNSAYFEIEYHIYASKSGKQIPLLFFASQLDNDFKVSIDGREIQTKQIQQNLLINGENKFSDFPYFYEKDQNNEDIFISEAPNTRFAVRLQDLVYFETNIPEGKHVIKVSYKASAWIDGYDWINKYSFRYALSPAKYWKSFGTLTITVNTSGFKGNIKTNLGNPDKGDLKTIAQWEFNKMPVDLIMIEYKPEINKTAQILLNIKPMGLALILGFILLILHLFLAWTYRKKHPDERFSPVVIAGSLIVPLLFVIFWMYSFYFVDDVIGKHASSHHAYSFMVLFFYPVILPFYWLILWLTDRFIYKKMIK